MLDGMPKIANPEDSIGVYAVVCYGSGLSASTGPLTTDPNGGLVAWIHMGFGTVTAKGALAELKAKGFKVIA